MTEKQTSPIILNGKEFTGIEIIDQEHDHKLIAKITFDKVGITKGYAVRLTK